jgi:hypothetical protein
VVQVMKKISITSQVREEAEALTVYRPATLEVGRTTHSTLPTVASNMGITIKRVVWRSLALPKATASEQMKAKK